MAELPVQVIVVWYVSSQDSAKGLIGARGTMRTIGNIVQVELCRRNRIAGQGWAATGGGKVVTYPAPAGETLSSDYEVEAGGQKVDVYTARVLDPPFAGKE